MERKGNLNFSAGRAYIYLLPGSMKLMVSLRVLRKWSTEEHPWRNRLACRAHLYVWPCPIMVVELSFLLSFFKLETGILFSFYIQLDGHFIMKESLGN